MPVLPRDQRRGNFREIELGFTEEMAKKEAERCLSCGGCSECMECEKICEAEAVIHSQREEYLELNVDAIIVATGFDPFDPSGIGQYGYGRLQNVISSLEYERLICASGPTGGRLKRPSDGGPVENIAFIQCVGSRDLNNNPYCSSVCCMYATKEAIIASEHDPNVRSYIFYMDLRAAGKGFQKYSARAESEYNTSYIRGRVASITEDANENPIIIYEDVENSKPERMAVDLTVLVTSLVPSRGAEDLAGVLGIEIENYGFFRTEPFSPLDTTRPGIFACGCCREPADIPECVSQASGAAARAAEVMRHR
jgi:heterodisulfide reductase subunit A-like polyferredoxin